MTDNDRSPAPLERPISGTQHSQIPAAPTTDAVAPATEQAERQSFRRDLAKLVVDKLLIGAVILLLGFIGSRWLEKFKYREAFVTDLNKLRVEKMSEVWQKLNVYEPDLQSAAKVFDPPPFDPDTSDSEWEQLVKKRNEANEKLGAIDKELHDYIEARRFWLSDEDYSNAQNYLAAVKEYFDAKKADKPDELAIQKAQEKRKAFRATLAGTRDKMLSD